MFLLLAHTFSFHNWEAFSSRFTHCGCHYHATDFTDVDSKPTMRIPALPIWTDKNYMAISSRVFRAVRNFSFKSWGGSKWTAAGWMLSQLRSALGSDSSVKADLKGGWSVWHPLSRIRSMGVKLRLTYQTMLWFSLFISIIDHIKVTSVLLTI